MDKVSLSSIEYRDISSVIEYSANAKTHPENQINQIANSIAEFSFLDPIAIDENNIILEGHGRLAAAKKMGIEQIPVIQVKGLTDAQKKGYRLVHNKLTMNSGFEEEALAQELQSLEELGFSLELTGFDTSELDDLFNTPNFEPTSEDEQGRLDEKQMTDVECECPNCGEKFIKQV